MPATGREIDACVFPHAGGRFSKSGMTQMISLLNKAQVFQDGERYFNSVWKNNPKHFTVDYPAYEDNSLLRRFLYRLMEGAGMSSF